MLEICESSVKKRTSSDQSLVLYNYPPKLVALGTYDQIDGMELIEADVSFYSSDGKQLKTVLKVGASLPLPYLSSPMSSSPTPLLSPPSSPFPLSTPLSNPPPPPLSLLLVSTYVY
jgi:hypothetical protein